jgi:hypothetical protein
MPKHNEIISIHDEQEWEPKEFAEWQSQTEQGFGCPNVIGHEGTPGPPGCWRGFFKESKSYMGYTKHMPRKDKLAFWKGLPRAWIVYHWEWLKDKYWNWYMKKFAGKK